MQMNLTMLNKVVSFIVSVLGVLIIVGGGK